MQEQRLNWSRDKDILCLARVRENRFRAHMAVEAPGSAQETRMQGLGVRQLVLDFCRSRLYLERTS
jgi:hypothetical protein